MVVDQTPKGFFNRAIVFKRKVSVDVFLGPGVFDHRWAAGVVAGFWVCPVRKFWRCISISAFIDISVI